MLEPPRASDCTIIVVNGGIGFSGCEAPSSFFFLFSFLVVTELRELVFQLEADLKAHWGVHALYACVLSPPQGALELPRTYDTTVVVVSGGLGSTGCEAPCLFLVVTDLRELVFQLEKPT